MLVNLDDEITKAQAAMRVAREESPIDQERRLHLVEAQKRLDASWRQIQELAAGCASRLAGAGVRPRPLVVEVMNRTMSRPEFVLDGHRAWTFEYGANSHNNHYHLLAIRTDGELGLARQMPGAKSPFDYNEQVAWIWASENPPVLGGARTAVLTGDENGTIFVNFEDGYERAHSANVREVLVNGIAAQLMR